MVKERTLPVLKPNPGPPACGSESQTRETVVRRKVIYSIASISRRWGHSCPEKLIFPSLVKPAIRMGSWWGFRKGTFPRGTADIQFLLREGSETVGSGLKRGCAAPAPSFPLPMLSFSLPQSDTCGFAAGISIPPFPGHLCFIPSESISHNCSQGLAGGESTGLVTHFDLLQNT